MPVEPDSHNQDPQYEMSDEDREWLGFPSDGRAELQPEIDRLRAQVAGLELQLGAADAVINEQTEALRKDTARIAELEAERNSYRNMTVQWREEAHRYKKALETIRANAETHGTGAWYVTEVTAALRG